MYKYYTVENVVVDAEKIQEVINNSVNADVISPIKTLRYTKVNDVAPDPTPPVTANYTVIPYKK